MSFPTYDGKIAESQHLADRYNKMAFTVWLDENPKITYEQAVNSGRGDMFKEVAWELFTGGDIGVEHWMEDCGLDLFLDTLEDEAEGGAQSERDKTREVMKLLYQYMKQTRLSIVECKAEAPLEPRIRRGDK